MDRTRGRPPADTPTPLLNHSRTACLNLVVRIQPYTLRGLVLGCTADNDGCTARVVAASPPMRTRAAVAVHGDGLCGHVVEERGMERRGRERTGREMVCPRGHCRRHRRQSKSAHEREIHVTVVSEVECERHSVHVRWQGKVEQGAGRAARNSFSVRNGQVGSTGQVKKKTSASPSSCPSLKRRRTDVVLDVKFLYCLRRTRARESRKEAGRQGTQQKPRVYVANSGALTWAAVLDPIRKRPAPPTLMSTELL